MYYLGIDLGGTNIAAAVVDENFKIKNKTYVDKSTGAYVTSVPSDDKPTGTMKFFAKHGISKVYGGSIGFSEKEQKWYGWTHRGCCAFGIGDEERECYPGETKIGKKCKTLDDCKQAAIKFMKSIS